ncbi:cytochrome P450 3A29-like [Galendromus occidentalis]|uniref:Cytochrome P450 3A29-like n=1 Tax=Galendromus occidentalis TaxID=34638 RepID=A0AAJ6QME1_9ACAR|nr:cytochrome P450 3A29-like [Galendromus occidentalis]
MWLVLLGVLLALLVIKISQISQFWRDRGIPYEPYWRYLYRMIWEINRRPIGDVQRELVKRYGPMYGSYHGSRPTLVVTDVEIVKEVFVKKFESFFSRSFEFTTGEPLWDNSILQLPKDEWKAVRTIMGYTFTTSKLRGMILKLDVICKRLLSKLDTIIDQEGTLSKYFNSYAVDSIAAIALGMDVNSIDNPDSEFVKCCTGIFKPGVASLLALVAPQLLRYVPFVHFPPKKTVDFFTKLSKHVIGEKKKNLDEALKNGTADILDLHLLAQREDPQTILTDEILASQAFIFIVGLDNTVLTLELATYFLTVFPEAQARAIREIRSVIGDKSDVDYEDLQKLKFVDACLREALRITPMGGVIDRVCNSDTVVAGQEIHKGMLIEFNFPHMHNDPKYFPEPEKYKPERFLRNEGDGPLSELDAFMMFGHGPKNCVGKRLALMNMQILLSNLLLRFKLEKTDRTPKLPLKLKPGFRGNDITVEPLMLKLVPRVKVNDA